MAIDSKTWGLIRQLEALHTDLQTQIKRRAIQQTEKELLFLCDDICAAYITGSEENRVDLQVAFDGRDALVNQLVTYFGNTATQALKAAQRKKQTDAVQHIRQGAAANSIIGTRAPESDLETTDNQLLEAAKMVRYDVARFALALQVPYKAYAQRAMQYNKGGDRIRALKALGLALQDNPKLSENTRINALAVTLTNTSQHQAILTLSDAYLRKKFVLSLEHEAEMKRLAEERPQSRSPLERLRSLLS